MGKSIPQWPDGRVRCAWCNPKNPLYIAYHDYEWGTPVHDDRKFLEMLILENFQAGLSWECVLNKREAFRAAFSNFDLAEICAFDDAKIAALSQNPGIIRNRLKIAAAIGNARVFRDIQREWGTFSSYMWSWTGGKRIFEKGLVKSPISDRLARDLKNRGMKFMGSVIAYSYLQATGLVYSHAEGCFLENAE